MRKLALLLCLVPQVALSDAAEDKGWIVNWLQDNLSGAGRKVEIDGFQGALSSQASLERLTIADDQGVWLTLTGVTLDWSRSALLSGRVEVNALTAKEIDLARLPAAQGATAEAGGFALPELPVSVSVAGVSAEVIRLGAPVLGEEVLASLTADLVLEGGAGTGHLNLTRSDAEGHVRVSASYGNAEGVLSLDLDAAEGPGGIAARKLGVPGAPSTSLRIAGTGPLSDFTAQVKLATDGATRLGGLVTLKQGAFSAILAGDPTPVFLPEYAAFFGPNVALQVKGSQGPGGLVLDSLALQSAALTLEGRARFAPGGRPELLDLTGRLGLGGAAVTLPLTAPVTVTGGTLALYHDISAGPDWTLDARLNGLTTASLVAAEIAVSAKGDLAEGVFDGQAEVTAKGLKATDPALDRALGTEVAASARFHSDDNGLTVENLAVTTPGLSVATLGRIGLDGVFDGQASGRIDDLTRISGYQPGLSGAVTFDLAGSVAALTGAFDLTGTLEGRALTIGQAEADALLAGDSRIEVSALRDESGITLRRLGAVAGGLSANLSGKLASAGSDLTGQVAIADLRVIGRKGSVAAEVQVTGTPAQGSIAAKLTGQDLGIGQAEVDKLLRGASVIDLQATVTDGALVLQAFDLKSDQLTAQAAGPLEGLQVTARLTNLGLFVPEFPGPVTLAGKAGWQEGAVLDLKVQGPAQIAAQVAGRLGTRLTIKGTAAAALANPFLRPRSVSGGLRFDLALAEMSLSGLSGTAQLTDGRFADPALPFGLTGMGGSVQLAGGRATLRAEAGVTSGGTAGVTGSVGLAAPYASDLAITLAGVKLRDPQLYETTVGGEMAFRGPALGGASITGALTLGRTELRIPSTLASSAALEGLTHRGDSAAVRATRARAEGDSVGKTGASGPAYGLNLRITAPNQVFLRGRGLDAELGGGLTLGGTTQAMVPTGGFTLLRGRMDILGRRMTLSEASLDLQGALIPMVHVVASVEAADITAIVTVDGPATAPEVAFTSSPALPQEEVLAQLLFGRSLETVSAFQAAQLASAVATLAGRGGEGIMGKIRAKTGLDNLDVQTDGAGGGSLTAGKYLSEKLYSEVTVDSAGKSDISLNLDVARHITLRATVDTEGNSGAGIFLKKDY